MSTAEPARQDPGREHDDARRGNESPPAEPAPRRPAYGQIREDLGAPLDQPHRQPPRQPRQAKKRPDGRLLGALAAAGILIAVQAYAAGGQPAGWPLSTPAHANTPGAAAGQAPGLDPQPARFPGREEAVPAPSATPAPSVHARTNPTPGRESRPTPLGTPAPLPAQIDSYAFLGLPEVKQDLVAYDPCRPIHFVMRAANAPAGGQEMVNAGFAELSRVTGLQFVNDGGTLEGPSDERPMYQPDSYGATRDAFGYAGSWAASPGAKDPYVYVTGQVVLNAPLLSEYAAVEGPALEPAVIAHELAHLVGLEHVDDPTQLMYPEAGFGVYAYAGGDLTGLAALGHGTCAPAL
ncbi:hypothetical protein [Pseudarthrobacter sp. efr-133-R2A-89]|uniref:hypothetical protein n=1 Tax=Pseudarthrobacter sp. efr-133-R2A-89 TaxID=3040302 RepID=UPI002552E9DE|nr:hypothetical protein [Pseudarthrobacter sp. efr-133-R2A-89]